MTIRRPTPGIGSTTPWAEGFTDTEFEACTGTSKKGENACKYYIYLTEKKDEAAKVEGDFLAVLRMLK